MDASFAIMTIDKLYSYIIYKGSNLVTFHGFGFLRPIHLFLSKNENFFLAKMAGQNVLIVLACDFSTCGLEARARTTGKSGVTARYACHACEKFQFIKFPRQNSYIFNSFSKLAPNKRIEVSIRFGSILKANIIGY